MNLVGLLQYTAIVYGFMADILVFNETIRTLDVLGALVIVSITVGVSLYKVRSKANHNDQTMTKS